MCVFCSSNSFNVVFLLHSATLGGILDRAVEAEDQKHGDIMRLVNYSINPLFHSLHIHLIVKNTTCLGVQDHVEGYLELSAKTKAYFATAVSLWDAEYYVKVDDDVHVNIGMTLSIRNLVPKH